MIENVTPKANLTLNQWLVREAIRAQSIADMLWDSLNNLQPLEDFQAIHKQYEDICDWMDKLEDNPEQLFNSLLT